MIVSYLPVSSISYFAPGTTSLDSVPVGCHLRDTANTLCQKLHEFPEGDQPHFRRLFIDGLLSSGRIRQPVKPCSGILSSLKSPRIRFSQAKDTIFAIFFGASDCDPVELERHRCNLLVYLSSILQMNRRHTLYVPQRQQSVKALPFDLTYLGR